MEDDEIQAVFNKFDVNKDGLITVKEYINGCRKNGNFNWKE
jgi:Ca2+-binding EF-hand superfamily protein